MLMEKAWWAWSLVSLLVELKPVLSVCRWYERAVALLCVSTAWRGGKPYFSRRQAGMQARQIQQLSFTLLLLLLALLYPIALTATSLALPSPHTHAASPAYQWGRGGRRPLSSNCEKGRSGQGLRFFSTLQVRCLREGVEDGFHCGFAPTTATDHHPLHTHKHIWSGNDRRTHTKTARCKQDTSY